MNLDNEQRSLVLAMEKKRQEIEEMKWRDLQKLIKKERKNLKAAQKDRIKLEKKINLETLRVKKDMELLR